MSFSNLIVGLGNPGQEYRHTRHNIGFRVIDHLLDRHSNSLAQNLCRSIVWCQDLYRQSVVLAKPLTFMNHSGQAVGQLIDQYEVPPEQTLVIYDDLNLAFGTFRIRRSGSAGGQNGMKSIIQHLKTTDFPRLRVGIGQPTIDSFIDHVLSDFSEDEADQLEGIIATAVDAVESFVQHGIIATMNAFNGKENR